MEPRNDFSNAFQHVELKALYNNIVGFYTVFYKHAISNANLDYI